MRRTVIAALCGLLFAGLLVVGGPASGVDSLGTATARDQVIHKGCHAYPYSYRVTPPPYTSTWVAEIFLIGPSGGKVGSAAYMSPADGLTGKGAWRMCRRAMTPGKYTMRMKVTHIEIYDVHTAWVKPTTFRISRR